MTTEILVCDLPPSTAYGSESSTADGSLRMSASAGTSVTLKPGAAPPPATDYRMLYEDLRAKVDAFSAALKSLLGMF